MIRNVLGSVVALIGAAGAVQSPFSEWYNSRLGRDYRVQDLFGGITTTSSGVMVSILLPFMFAALVVIVGVILRSRPLVAFAGVVVLGFTVLWMVRQGQAAGGLTVSGDGSGLRMGVASAAAGGVLILLGSLLMSGRVKRAGRHAAPYRAPGADHPDTWPPTQEPGMSAQTTPWPEPEADPYTGPDPGAPHDPHDPRSRSAAPYDDHDTAPFPTVRPEHDEGHDEGHDPGRPPQN
ncbi:hypothetical protein OG413_07095 [Streptomyces sp. NBC_01433]|uniref:hypothetical protein n=1 Tax=Streptomyces sp. NBC_01433 TaxID=2903864 RepID=UPI002253DE7E|nr:hypothetical protein [Streptomyces sp. NBC_01433]MCX4675091.1 hypothetical protein [Streptomyces sp. NBC_01433]